MKSLPGVIDKIRRFEGEVIATRDTHDAGYMDSEEGRHLPVVHCVKGTKGWRLRTEVEGALAGKG